MQVFGIFDKIRLMRKIITAALFKKMQLLTVEFSVTDRCDLTCKYCIQVFDIHKQGRVIEEMTIDQIKKTLDNFRSIGVERINFSGGEPFLREDIDEIIKDARMRGFTCTITTNGTFVSKHRKILKHIDLLIVSLDGQEKTHNWLKGDGTYSKVVQTLEIAKEEKIPVMLSTVLTNRTSLDDINHVLQLAGNYNCRCLIQQMNNQGWLQGKWQAVSELNVMMPDKAQIKKAFEYIKQHKLRKRLLGGKFWCNLMIRKASLENVELKSLLMCFAGRLFLNIEPDGTLTSCSLSHDPLFKSKSFEDDLLDSVKNSLKPKKCLGCDCYSYILINQVALFKKATLWQAILGNI